jgi:hypothetical protein
MTIDAALYSGSKTYFFDGNGVGRHDGCTRTGRSRRSRPFLDPCSLCRRREGGQGGVPAAQRGEPTLTPCSAVITIAGEEWPCGCSR